MAQIISRAAVNNAILDPLSGFDVDVFVQDQESGKQMLAGSFTSFQFTVRNATEPYMEFNQRIPRLLDGEMQFGWVLERGCIDTRFIEQTFGITAMSREMRINRSPRFQITVELNAPELDQNTANDVGDGYSYTNTASGDTRRAKGRYRLIYAKTDTLTFGAMAGRSVVANRWEGLCEGILYSDSGTFGWSGVDLGRSTTSRETINSNTINTFNAVSTQPSWVTPSSSSSSTPSQQTDQQDSAAEQVI